MVAKIDLGTFQRSELVRLKAETLFYKIKVTTTRTFEKFLDQFLRPFECFFQNDGLEPFSKFSNIFQIFH